MSTAKKKTTKNLSDKYIKFDPKMAKRIEKVQRPVIKSSEQFQRMQIGGANTILNDYSNKVVAALVSIGAISSEFLEEAGRKMVALTDEFWTQFNNAVDPAHVEAVHLVLGGMQVSATNYIGMVLEGLMDPIYDSSLDCDEDREEISKALIDICHVVNEDLSAAGVLEEASDGSLKIKEEYKIYNQVGDKKGKKGEDN